MELQTHPPNPITMGVLQLKEILHLRIEQADEKFLKVLAAMTEVYFQEHEPEAAKVEDAVIGYQAGEAMDVAQLKSKIIVAEDQIDRGEFLTPEELEKEAEGWLSESIV